LNPVDHTLEITVQSCDTSSHHPYQPGT